MKPNMMYLLLLIFTLVSCNSGSGNPNGDFGNQLQGELHNENYDFWVSIEEAQERAYNDGKHIVLDIYTEWCGFCRRMYQETYSDERVQEALDKYFYPVRINAESTQEITFLGETYTKENLARIFGVASLPTTIFLSPEGEPLAVQPGFIDAEHFYKMLTYVGSQSYETTSFQEYSQSN